jgi:O-antigen ligase
MLMGIAAVAVIVGLVPGALSVAGAIFVAVLGLGALAVIAFRRTVPSAADTLSRNTNMPGANGWQIGSDRMLRVPRLLFYAGTLTLTQASLRPGPLTVSEIFFLLAFCATAAAVIAGRPVSGIPKGLVLGAGLFAVGGLISTPGAASPAGSISNTLQGVYVMCLWPLIGATVLRTRRQIVTALTLWTVSAAFDGFAALTQVGGIQALAGPLEGSRATGLTDHPNDLGGVCAIALVPALMLATNRLPWQAGAAGSLGRAPRWVVLGLIAAGLVLSASVAAMLAGLVAILVWVIAPGVRAPGRMAVIVALGFTLIAVTFAAGTVTSPSERLQEVTSTSGTESTSGSGGIRIRTINRALPRIADDPVVGTGLDVGGGVVTIISQGTSIPQQVHGAPVAVWYQAGLFGLLGLLVITVVLLKEAWRSLATNDQTDLLIGLAISGAFIAFIVYALSSPFFYQQYGWFSGVVLIAWRYRRDAVAESAVPRATALPLRAATT